jgi:hypothetical protein
MQNRSNSRAADRHRIDFPPNRSFGRYLVNIVVKKPLPACNAEWGKNLHQTTKAPKSEPGVPYRFKTGAGRSDANGAAVLLSYPFTLPRNSFSMKVYNGLRQK